MNAKYSLIGQDGEHDITALLFHLVNSEALDPEASGDHWKSDVYKIDFQLSYGSHKCGICIVTLVQARPI